MGLVTRTLPSSPFPAPAGSQTFQGSPARHFRRISVHGARKRSLSRTVPDKRVFPPAGRTFHGRDRRDAPAFSGPRVNPRCRALPPAPRVPPAPSLAPTPAVPGSAPPRPVSAATGAQHPRPRGAAGRPPHPAAAAAARAVRRLGAAGSAPHTPSWRCGGRRCSCSSCPCSVSAYRTPGPAPRQSGGRAAWPTPASTASRRGGIRRGRAPGKGGCAAPIGIPGKQGDALPRSRSRGSEGMRCPDRDPGEAGGRAAPVPQREGCAAPTLGPREGRDALPRGEAGTGNGTGSPGPAPAPTARTRRLPTGSVMLQGGGRGPERGKTAQTQLSTERVQG